MPGTIEHEYQPEIVNAPVPEVGTGNEIATARLGPLHVPHSVAVSYSEPNTCLFRFIYPNSEAPEPRFRSTRINGLTVQLAKNTKKVLALRYSDAAAALQNGAPPFDPTESASWCSELTWDRRFVCSRNAELIAAIIAAMPEELRLRLVNEIRRPGGEEPFR